LRVDPQDREPVDLLPTQDPFLRAASTSPTPPGLLGFRRHPFRSRAGCTRRAPFGREGTLCIVASTQNLCRPGRKEIVRVRLRVVDLDSHIPRHPHSYLFETCVICPVTIEEVRRRTAKSTRTVR